MECFDNSNIQGNFPVAACVVFKNGKPSKKDYRLFNIPDDITGNDVASMEHVISRRLKYYEDMKPDLILIDGGKGQLNAALKSLESLGLKLPCVSLAKENEEVYLPKISKPVVIPKNKKSLQILQHARDETHRFGVAYNRTIRKNKIK